MIYWSWCYLLGITVLGWFSSLSDNMVVVRGGEGIGLAIFSRRQEGPSLGVSITMPPKFSPTNERKNILENIVILTILMDITRSV